MNKIIIIKYKKQTNQILFTTKYHELCYLIRIETDFKVGFQILFCIDNSIFIHKKQTRAVYEDGKDPSKFVVDPAKANSEGRNQFERVIILYLFKSKKHFDFHCFYF